MLKERENIIVSATEPTGKDREKVWMQYSNNIVNKLLSVDNRYVWLNNNTEQISSNNNYWSTGKLQVKPNRTYYIDKYINYIVYYNNSGIAVRLETDKVSSFTTASNEYYVQLSFSKSKIAYNADIMISTTENSAYKPYAEPKMHVLNDNNVYEEFVSKQEKIVLWEGSSLSSIIQLNDKPSDFKYFMIETSVNITVIVPAVINGSGAGGYTAIENSTYVKYETYLRIINLNNSTNTIQFSPSYLFRNNTYSKSANVTKIIGIK